MPAGLERAAWGVMASYTLDCDCQFKLNALNYNLGPLFSCRGVITLSSPVDNLTACLSTPCISDLGKCNVCCFSAYRYFCSEWLMLCWKHYRNTEGASQHVLSLTNDTTLKELTSCKSCFALHFTNVAFTHNTNSIYQVIVLSQLCTVSLIGGNRKYVYSLLHGIYFLNLQKFIIPTRTVRFFYYYYWK